MRYLLTILLLMLCSTAQAQYELSFLPPMTYGLPSLDLCDCETCKCIDCECGLPVSAPVLKKAKRTKRVAIRGGFRGRRIIGYRTVEIRDKSTTKKSSSRGRRCLLPG